MPCWVFNLLDFAMFTTNPKSFFTFCALHAGSPTCLTLQSILEIFLRVNEFRERLVCLGFGEVVELVYVLNRLGKCKEILVITEKQKLWDLVRELKVKIEKMEVYREEGKRTVTTQRATKSDRFALTLVNSVDLGRFPSARFL